jgi:hypothetical protein
VARRIRRRVVAPADLALPPTSRLVTVGEGAQELSDWLSRTHPEIDGLHLLTDLDAEDVEDFVRRHCRPAAHRWTSTRIPTPEGDSVS